MLRPVAAGLLAVSLAAPPALAAGIKPLEEELSPRGKIMADCIAFYEALAAVIAKHDPSVLTYSGPIGDGVTPKMVLKHSAAMTRSQQLKRAFPSDLVEKAKREYFRVYDGYVADIDAAFPKGNKDLNQSLDACTEQNKWLDGRGVRVNGYRYLSFD